MKKVLALIIASLLFIIPVSSSADTIVQIPEVNYVVLGDSIASGYGIDNIHNCYASIISAQKGYHLANNAVPGHTTENLLWVICHSTVAREDIKKADLISVSICGNDIIHTLQKADTSTLFDIMLNGINAKVVQETAEKIEFNLDAVCKEIRALNPDAPIIFQSQYNPLYANEQYSSYASFAEQLDPLVDDIFSTLQNDYNNIFLADVHSAFDAYYKESGSYDIIHADGIHPSEKGHALIASVVLEKIDELEKAGLVPVVPKYYFLLGDTNSDHRISISDATTIQKILAGLLIFEGDFAKACLDADQNGDLNIKDATAIQKHLADLESNPNIGTYQPYYG